MHLSKREPSVHGLMQPEQIPSTKISSQRNNLLFFPAGSCCSGDRPAPSLTSSRTVENINYYYRKTRYQHTWNVISSELTCVLHISPYFPVIPVWRINPYRGYFRSREKIKSCMALMHGIYLSTLFWRNLIALSICSLQMDHLTWNDRISAIPEVADSDRRFGISFDATGKNRWFLLISYQ
jgi:hypothetical protein